MAVYTFTSENIYGDGNVNMVSSAEDLNRFVDGAAAEKAIILCSATIWSDNPDQLSAPFVIKIRDIDGKEKVISKVPDLDNYASITQITDFPLNFHFDGLSKIQYTVKANSKVQLILKINEKSSLTNWFIYQLEKQLNRQIEQQKIKIELREPEEVPEPKVKELKKKEILAREPEELKIEEAGGLLKKQYDTKEPEEITIREEIPVPEEKELPNKEIIVREPEEIEPKEPKIKQIKEQPKKQLDVKEPAELKVKFQKGHVNKQYDIKEPEETTSTQKETINKGWEFGDLFEPEEKLRSIITQLKEGLREPTEASDFKTPTIAEQINKKFGKTQDICASKDYIQEGKEKDRQKEIAKIKKEAKKEAQLAKKAEITKKKIKAKPPEKPEKPKEPIVTIKLWFIIPICVTSAMIYINYRNKNN
jgi:hypothetical protein